jgi:sarcosine oxidase subunit beta
VAARAGVLIAGGGIVGTALAWALAQRGVRDVVVADLDLAGVYASSELNAGGARATWWQPVNIESCRLTLDHFRAHAGEFGFRERGYLWLYEDAALFATAREKRALQNQAGLGVEVLAPAEVAARFPLLDRGREALLGATFSPRDGLVNPNAVRAWFRREAAALGVVFRDRDYVMGVRTERVVGPRASLRRVAALDVVRIRRGAPADASGALREILTTHRIPAEAVEGEERIECEVFVNCLGAWSALLLAKLGVPEVSEPVRRQISLVDVHRQDLAAGVALDALGMIVLASGLYFHPEGPHLLAGYSTPGEPPGYDFDYDGQDFFEGEIWPRLAERASSFERCGHVRGWAGLYDVTPDRSGIAGAVRGFANLYEAHSFTGRGVMQSYGIAVAMAALIASGRYEQVDLLPLTRERFEDPSRLVTEDLHI